MAQGGPGLYASAALKAREAVQHDVTSSYERCGHEDNLIIVHFLQEIRAEWVRREKDRLKTSSLAHAATSVREFPQRIYNAAMLESLPRIGPEIRRMVVEHLWSLPDCQPVPPTAEELQLEERRQAAEKAEKQRKAAKNKAEKQALQAQQEQIAQNALQPAAPPQAAAPEDSRPKKKARKKKEYIPGVGTASYAFLITLYKAHRHGEDHLTRIELCNRAEASGLSDHPIFGNGQAQGSVNNPQRWYNGWSTFSILKNREPPLVLSYSNPIKCKLTPEGTVLAEQLYKDAVVRHRISEDPAIPLTTLPAPGSTAAPSAAASGSGRAWQSAGSHSGAAASASAATARLSSAASAGAVQQPLPQPAARRSSTAAGGGRAAAVAAATPLAGGASTSGRRVLTPSQSVASGFAMPGISHAHGGDGLPNLMALPLRERLAAAQQFVEASMAALPGVAARQISQASHSGIAGQSTAIPLQCMAAAAPAGGFGRNAFYASPVAPQMVTSMPVAPGRAAPAQRPARRPEPEVVDLLDSDDEHVMATPAAPQQAPAQNRAAAAYREAGPSEVAPDADDTHVAQLVDMGFTPEQATTALKGGRSVEEAVEVLMISSDEDEDAGPQMPELEATQVAQPFGWALAGLPNALAAPDLRLSQASMPHSQQDTDALRGSQLQPGSQPEAKGIRRGGQAVERERPLLATQAAQAVPPRPAAATAAVGSVVASLAAASSVQQRAAGGAGPSWQRAQPNLVAQAAEVRAAQLARPAATSAPAQLTLPAQRSGSQASLQRNDSGASSAPLRATSEHSGQARKGVWRLQGLGGEWGVGDRDVRLPPLPPATAFRDCYEVVLVLDQREQFGRNVGGRVTGSRTESRDECVRQLRNLGINVEVRHSDTGDALWVARSRQRPEESWALDYVVERKSVHDLIGSIKQGRYEKQKYVLRRCGLRRVMYLIEGNPDIEAQGSDLKAVKTATLTTEVVDGFEVLHTDSVADTFRLYATITKRLVAKYGPLTSASPGVQRDGEALPTFQELRQRVSANMKITVRDVWGLMLTALPGVGAELAEAILRVYPTPLQLRTAYERAMRAAAPGASVQQAQSLLAGIKVSPSRKISVNQSAKVFDSLFAAGWHCV